MTTPDETTSGKTAARRALIESRRAASRTDSIIAEARAATASVQESRQRNHYADKFRAIIQGGRNA